MLKARHELVHHGGVGNYKNGNVTLKQRLKGKPPAAVHLENAIDAAKLLRPLVVAKHIRPAIAGQREEIAENWERRRAVDSTPLPILSAIPSEAKVDSRPSTHDDCWQHLRKEGEQNYANDDRERHR